LNLTNYSDCFKQLGWDPFFQQYFQALAVPGSEPARISSEFKNSYKVYSRYGDLTARLSGKMHHRADMEIGRPAVGDWVIITAHAAEMTCTIHAVLPRKSKFSRKAAGERTEEQVVAANVDTIFIVNGLDGGRNLNLRRIERYLTIAWNSGAEPVIVLNKTDLCGDVGAHVQDVEAIAGGIHIHPVSARERTGLDALRGYLGRGKTVAFLGSSGVGKSAIINALLGEERQRTGDVREGDLTGKHTTTRRDLILLPGGGLVIDTPGMREIQMWTSEDGLQDAFSEITTLGKQCRFHNCKHESEPGCAVREAIEKGIIHSSRLGSYRKLCNEIDYLDARDKNSTRLREKTKWKKIAQLSKEINKRHDS